MPAVSAFKRPQGRTDFERARQALRSAIDGDPGESARRYSDLTAALDTGVAALKPELIGSALCWNDDHRTYSSWIHRQHHELFELGRRFADFFSRSLGPADPRTLRLAALALFHWGEAVKWSLDSAERRDYAWVHWLFTLALDARRQGESGKLWVEGRARTVTIENLYFRALVLDRFAGGNLTRQQLEVLDAWLWDWAPDLAGFAAYPGGPVLRADLDSNAGLQHARREDLGRSVYLPLAPLEARRKRVVADFHRGKIVPASGCAADLRIEEHVAVLEALRRVFAAPGTACARRTPRTAAPGTPVEVWCGLSDIATRALAGAGTVGEALRLEAQSADAREPVRGHYGDVLSAPKRCWTLSDTSETGYGFEAAEADAAGIAVGDLVGLRLSRGRRCMLGRVVRRAAGRAPGRVALGVERLSEEARTVTLVKHGVADDAGEDFIFVPGEDASGSRDAFIVPERMLPDASPRDVRAGSSTFTLRFNRVCARGRGWALAGFEIDVPQAEAPRPREQVLEDMEERAPAEDPDELTRAFDRELSSRMM